MSDEHFNTGQGPVERDVELMRRMRWCSHLLYHRHNLNFSRNRILHLIWRHDGMTQKELMDHLRVQAGSLSEMLSKLEQQGLVEKTRCPQDKRNCRLSLTESGREQALLFEQERQDMARHLFSILTEDEKVYLGAITEKLIDHWSKTPSPEESEKENTHA